MIDTSLSVSLRQLDSLPYGNYGGTGEGGLLFMQVRMTDTDAAKVDVNAKSDAPDALDTSKIDTPNIDVKRGIGKPRAVVISMSWYVSLIQQALRDSLSYGEGTDTGKLDAKKRGKKEATKIDEKWKSDAISTSRRFSLRQKALRETNNSGLGVGEESGIVWKDKKQRRQVGEVGGKDRRRYFARAIAIFCEERAILIGGIEVGRYNKFNRAALDRAFGLNGSLTSGTRQVENISRKNDTLDSTLALTEEEAEKNYNETWVYARDIAQRLSRC